VAVPAGSQRQAQTFTNLHCFNATSGAKGYNGTNSDGEYEFFGIAFVGNTLYGTAQAGGSAGWGTVFAINTDGRGFTNLHSFAATSGTNGAYSSGTNLEGAWPNGGLILSGNTLYGTAQAGGSAGWGTVIAVNTDGTGFATCIISRPPLDLLAVMVPTATELILFPDCSYRATLCMEPRNVAALRLGHSVCRQYRRHGFTNLHNFTATSGSAAAMVLTATERIRLAD